MTQILSPFDSPLSLSTSKQTKVIQAAAIMSKLREVPFYDQAKPLRKDLPDLIRKWCYTRDPYDQVAGIQWYKRVADVLDKLKESLPAYTQVLAIWEPAMDDLWPSADGRLIIHVPASELPVIICNGPLPPGQDCVMYHYSNFGIFLSV